MQINEMIQRTTRVLMEVSIVGYFSHLQISAVLHTDESVINYFDSKCLSIDVSIQSRENDRETEEKKTNAVVLRIQCLKFICVEYFNKSIAFVVHEI